MAKSHDELARDQAMWLEAVATLRAQSVEDMILARARLPDADFRFGDLDGPGLSASELAPVIAKLPSAGELNRAASGVYVVATTAFGISLFLLTCDALGSSWVSNGVAVFLGEELDPRRRQVFALLEVRGAVFCTTLDQLERALDEPVEGELPMFKVRAATLDYAPAVPSA